LSKIDLEVSDSLDFEDGDIAVIIKQDGSIGRIIMPRMDKEILGTEGYRKLLDVVDIIQPGSKEKFIRYNMKSRGSIH